MLKKQEAVEWNVVSVKFGSSLKLLLLSHACIVPELCLELIPQFLVNKLMERSLAIKRCFIRYHCMK